MQKYRISLLNNIVGYGLAVGFTAWVAAHDVIVSLAYAGVGIVCGVIMTLLFAEKVD